MKQILIFISLFLISICTINAQSVTANQMNGRLQMTTVSNVSDSTWSITGYFTNSVNKYLPSNINVNDKFFCQIGANTYVGRISVINSRSDVTKLITFRVICNYPNPPNNIGAIIRVTSNGYPVFVDGLPNALQAGIQNYFATLINTNAAGNPCERTITKTAHGFVPGTPLRWNGSAYVRPTIDSLIPDLIVVRVLTANTFVVSTCGVYPSDLPDGLYWYTSAAPGYSLTQDTVKVPLFQVLRDTMMLNPIVGFNLMSQNADGNGLISALPLADVVVQSSNDLYLKDATSGFHKTVYKNSAGATGTEIYRGSVNVRKLTTGSSGGFFRIIDTTGVGNTFYEGQLDFNFVQNSGSGPQLSKAVAGIKVVGGEKSYFGVRNDTSGTIPIVRMMYGDRYSNVTTPDMHLFRAAVPNSATAYDAPFKIQTSSSSGKLSVDIDGSLFVRENGKVYMGADSSFLHNPAVDTTLAKGSLRIFGTTTQSRFNKSEYTDVYGSTLETGLDISSRYNASWASRFVVNSYGYLDLINVENNGDNPRFNFYNSRGTSETTKARSQPNDYVGFVMFSPYNGTAYHRGAAIGTSIAANSAAGSTRFSQTMFFGIDKSGNSPQISSNWLLALDTIRAWIPKNLQVGGVANGSSATLFVNNTGGGNIGVNTVTPTSKLQVLGSVAFQVTTISSATTLGEHSVIFATGASTYLVTLPTASTCTGRQYTIKTNGGGKTISSFLDLTGSASTTLTNNTVITIVSDGTNWQQIQ